MNKQEEIELEKKLLEKEAVEFCKKYYLPNLKAEECLKIKKQFDRSLDLIDKRNIDVSYGGAGNVTLIYQNFYILEQLGRNQQQLEQLNDKFDKLIDLLSKK